MIGNLDFVAAEPASPSLTPAESPLLGHASRSSAILRDMGCVETAELVGRLADRLMRQELLLAEERARCADLEFKLARFMAAVPAAAGGIVAKN